MATPYETLGVAKNATHKEIQKAYRKLAKLHHPDLNPGDLAAEEKFKKASAAYAILGEETNRERYDRGEIDDDGNEVMARGFQQSRGAGQSDGVFRQGTTGFADFADADDVFSSFFSGMGRGSPRARKGQDVRYKLDISLVDAAAGVSQTVALSDEVVEVRVPAGVRDGQTLRVAGKGHVGQYEGQRGDALVEIHILPHPHLGLDGDNLRAEVPITLREAVLGARVKVPTLSGNVAVTVPPNTSTGKQLRLKGKGYPNKHGGHGDMLMSLKVVLPPVADKELTEFMQTWTEGESFNPREW